MPEDPAPIFYESSRILLGRRTTSVGQEMLWQATSQRQNLYGQMHASELRIDFTHTWDHVLRMEGKCVASSDHPANRTQRGTCRHNRAAAARDAVNSNPPPQPSIVDQIIFFSKTLW